MSNDVAMRVRSGSWFRNAVAALSVSLMVMSSQQPGQAQAADALPFSKGFLVTGNYVVGGVDLDPHAIDHGFITGTVPMSGVPAGADVIAAYLYWETISTNVAQVNGARFRGSPVTVVKASSTPLKPSTSACWSSGGGGGASYTMTMYRADVLRLLPVQLGADGQPNGRRLVNDADLLGNGFPLSTVTLPEGSGNQVPSGAGATLLVVYRDPSEPLTKISLYDGIYVQEPGATMNQTIRGFYQSNPTKAARITQVVGRGAPNGTDRLFFNNSNIATNAFAASNSQQSDRGWSNPTYDVSSLMPGTDRNIGYGEEVTTRVDHTKASPYDCLAWAAIVFSTSVKDDDADGLPDKLEDVSGLMDPDGKALPDLHAMGASSRHKDLFVELGAMKAKPGTAYGSIDAPLNADTVQVVDGAGHNHLPTPAVLKLVGDSFKNAPVDNPDGTKGIRAHFDAGPAYHSVDAAYASTDADEYLVPSTQARGE